MSAILPTSHATAYTATIRQVVSPEVGQRSTSLIQSRRVVDGSTLEKISDIESRGNPRCTSEINPLRKQNSILSPTYRLSVDGANIESISDNLQVRSSNQVRSFLFNSASKSASASPLSSQNTPQRSKFANHGRRAPSNLVTPKRRTFLADSTWSSDSLSLSPPSVVRLRPTPFQLPKLVIPENGRPPVKPMRAEWLNQDFAEIKTVAKPTTRNLNHDPDSPISLPDSLMSITRKMISYAESTSPELSPLSTPVLSHNIRLPSALDFPDLTFTPQTDTSPVRSTTTTDFDAISAQQTVDAPTPNRHENGSMSLISAIYKILRNPSSAGSNQSSRLSLSSPSPSSPVKYISPLFSTRSPPRPLEFSRLSSYSSSGKSKSCNVCGEDILITKFPIRPTARCRHESSTCQDCIVHWIQSCMSDGKLDAIKCPNDLCTEDLLDEDVEFLAPPDVFNRYHQLLTVARLSTHENFRWCLNPNCTSGQIHEIPYSGHLMRCHACKFPQCVLHDCEWHYGESCYSYGLRTNSAGRRRREEQYLSDVTIMNTTKECPQCKVRIEKSEGCDHMRCSRCLIEYCWSCNARYSPIRKFGNAFHDTSCRHHFT